MGRPMSPTRIGLNTGFHSRACVARRPQVGDTRGRALHPIAQANTDH